MCCSTLSLVSCSLGVVQACTNRSGVPRAPCRLNSVCAGNRLMASVAGVYTLSVANSQAEAVKGSPLEIAIMPNVISAAHSSAELAHSSIVAGSQAELLLTARDMYGNQVWVCLTATRKAPSLMPIHEARSMLGLLSLTRQKGVCCLHNHQTMAQFWPCTSEFAFSACTILHNRTHS